MKILIILICFLASINIQAQSLESNRLEEKLADNLPIATNNIKVLMSKSIENLPVNISHTKIKLTNLGYSSFVVKVLIPELAEVTLLNHRNQGEEAPCLATYEAFTIDQVIQNNPVVENIDFTIERFKILTPLFHTQQCQVDIMETVNGKVRGFHFTHIVTNNIGLRHIDDCR